MSEDDLDIRFATAHYSSTYSEELTRRVGFDYQVTTICLHPYHFYLLPTPIYLPIIMPFFIFTKKRSSTRRVFPVISNPGPVHDIETRWWYQHAGFLIPLDEAAYDDEIRLEGFESSAEQQAFYAQATNQLVEILKQRGTWD
ncbi:hypothetical protein K474DRAFT_1773013 [Panus rudis PR-1116 ss-1]|nr:hypothetical protein K474DRAFT_1773013 [Panus rudis PR-1116 ss-1]